MSVSKRARAKDMNGQLWSNGNTNVVLLTKTEWPRERTETHQNGVMETGPNGNEIKS